MASIESRRRLLLKADALTEQGQVGLARAIRLLREGIATMEVIAADPEHPERARAVEYLMVARPELAEAMQLAAEAQQLRRFLADTDAALD